MRANPNPNPNPNPHPHPNPNSNPNRNPNQVSRYPALFPHFVADARNLREARAVDAEAEAAADADAGADAGADVASLPVAAADWAEHLWHGCGMGASQANAQAKTLLPKPLARARAAPSCRNELGQKLKQSGLLEHHPAHDHYVREVWELLARWVPGLDAYWLQKVEPTLGLGLANPSPNPNQRTSSPRSTWDVRSMFRG